MGTYKRFFFLGEKSSANKRILGAQVMPQAPAGLLARCKISPGVGLITLSFASLEGGPPHGVPHGLRDSSATPRLRCPQLPIPGVKSGVSRVGVSERSEGGGRSRRLRFPLIGCWQAALPPSSGNPAHLRWAKEQASRACVGVKLEQPSAA